MSLIRRPTAMLVDLRKAVGLTSMSLRVAIGPWTSADLAVVFSKGQLKRPAQPVSVDHYPRIASANAAAMIWSLGQVGDRVHGLAVGLILAKRESVDPAASERLDPIDFRVRCAVSQDGPVG